MSRRIVIQGSEDDSEPTDLVTSKVSPPPAPCSLVWGTCQSNKSPWSEKCAWRGSTNNCVGCPECSLARGRHSGPATCALGDALAHRGYPPDVEFLGDSGVPCNDTLLTGYGGHVMAEGTGATLRVSGVELVRMGQTNVIGRYPMHAHMMGAQGGSRSYFKDASVHQSYYRCISLHGTHQMTVANNVAFDAIGHCYYLEDGVEENNTLAYNLAAHIHFLGSPGTSSWGSQFTLEDTSATSDLRVPADMPASGFYITNGYNRILGNAASGGWGGFAFPMLTEPLALSSQVSVTPAARPLLEFNGNSAHSCGWWWKRGGCVYFGGKACQRVVKRVGRRSAFL